MVSASPRSSKTAAEASNVRFPIEAHRQFYLEVSLASAVAEKHPFEDILTADVLVDILYASASFEVFSALVPRDMNVVFVNPDFYDHDAELFKILIFADEYKALGTFRVGYLVRSAAAKPSHIR